MTIPQQERKKIKHIFIDFPMVIIQAIQHQKCVAAKLKANCEKLQPMTDPSQQSTCSKKIAVCNRVVDGVQPHKKTIMLPESAARPHKLNHVNDVPA